MDSCWLCSAESKMRCEDCGLVSSCSSDHLSLHRHNQTCRPFTVKRNQSVGRYLVATRRIEPLETILTEPALCVGPCRDGQLVCVECLNTLDQVTSTCPACQLPLCGSVSCVEVKQHQAECDYIQRSKWSWRKDPDKLSYLLESLTTIRMISHKKRLRSQPSGYSAALFDLSVGNGDISEIDDNVIDVAREVMGEDFDVDEFTRSYHQLFINGKSLGCDNSRQRGSGLFLLFSIMNHSCVANTFTILNQSGNIQVNIVPKIFLILF